MHRSFAAHIYRWLFQGRKLLFNKTSLIPHQYIVGRLYTPINACSKALLHVCMRFSLFACVLYLFNRSRKAQCILYIYSHIPTVKSHVKPMIIMAFKSHLDPDMCLASQRGHFGDSYISVALVLAEI